MRDYLIEYATGSFSLFKRFRFKNNPLWFCHLKNHGHGSFDKEVGSLFLLIFSQIKDLTFGKKLSRSSFYSKTYWFKFWTTTKKETMYIL